MATQPGIFWSASTYDLFLRSTLSIHGANYVYPLSTIPTSSGTATYITVPTPGYVHWVTSRTTDGSIPCVVATNEKDIIIPNMPAATTVALAYHDRNNSSGTYRTVWGDLVSGVTTTSGQRLVIPAGQIRKVFYEALYQYGTYSFASYYLQESFFEWYLNGATQLDTTYSAGLTTTHGTMGTAGTEVSGGSYARQSMTFRAVYYSNFTGINNTLSFTGLPAATITGMNIYDSTGTYCFYLRFDAATTVTAGGSIDVAQQQFIYNGFWTGG